MPEGRDETTEPEHKIAVCEAEKHKINVVCEKEKHTVRCIKEDSLNAQPFSVNLDIDTLNKMTSGSCMIGSTVPRAHNNVGEPVAICKEGKTIKIFKIVEEKK